MNTEDNNDFYDDELSRSLISNDFEGDTPHRKKKSKKPLVSFYRSFLHPLPVIDNYH